MDVTSCMAKTTNRQYLAWQYWLDNQWNKPTLTHWYLMQIAQLVKKPTKILNLSTFKLHMERKPLPTEASKQTMLDTAVAYSKAKWSALTGKKPKGP